MNALSDLRRTAQEIFTEALRSVDAVRAVRRAVRVDGAHLIIGDATFGLATRRKKIYAIAIGKAALRMAKALDEILGERLTAGIITDSSSRAENERWLMQQFISVGQISEEKAETHTFRQLIAQMLEKNPGNVALDRSLTFSNRWRVFAGGHPLPNEESLDAARASFSLLRCADDERAIVIFLISGGGSAMIEWPRDEQTTLEDLRTANRALVSCGARIEEINAVRRAFSAVKGGGLAARAPHADQVSLIISDVGAGREMDVASGPTFEPSPHAPDAKTVVERYNLAQHLPPPIRRAVDQSPAAKNEILHSALRKHYVLLDNESAMKAAAEAARSRGFTVEIAHDLIEQPIADGCSQLLSRLHAGHRPIANEGQMFCLISGGEFACPVTGDGVGGRNAETALRCAIEIDARPGDESSITHVVALSAGTDGIDGNSPAAGAFADETTLARARTLNLDAQSFLRASDAYTFFKTLGDAIVTGPTGTNVRDLRILLAS